MSLTLPSFKVFSVCGYIFPCQFTANTQTFRLYPNPLYRKKSYQMCRHLIISSLALLLCPFLIYRSLWFFCHWKSFTSTNIDQAVIYAIMDLEYMLILSIYYQINSKHIEIQYFVNQHCKLVSENCVTNNMIQIPFIEKFSFETICVYCCAFCFLLLPLASGFLPFAISYDPVQINFGSCTAVKIIGGLYYSVLQVAGVTLILNFVLLEILLAEGLSKHSSNPYSHSFLPTAKCFQQCYQRYRTTQILFTLQNNLFTLLRVIGVFSAIVIASCGAYVVFKLYHVLSIIIYVAAFCNTIFICVIVIVVTRLHGLSYKNIKNLISFWRRHLTRKEDRKRLLGCRVVGFGVGPYGISVSQLGLKMCDDIVNNCVNLLLLNVA